MHFLEKEELRTKFVQEHFPGFEWPEGLEDKHHVDFGAQPDNSFLDQLDRPSTDSPDLDLDLATALDPLTPTPVVVVEVPVARRGVSSDAA
jgi:hypothetical protein